MNFGRLRAVISNRTVTGKPRLTMKSMSLRDPKSEISKTSAPATNRLAKASCRNMYPLIDVMDAPGLTFPRKRPSSC